MEASASGPVCRFKRFGCEPLKFGYKLSRMYAAQSGDNRIVLQVQSAAPDAMHLG